MERAVLPSADQRLYCVELVSLQCNKTEEGGIVSEYVEEVCVTIGGERVWGKDMRVGPAESIINQLRVLFTYKTQIELKREDPRSPDDSFGRITVYASEVYGGDRTAMFKGNNRDYVLTYRIVDMSHLVAPISKDVTDQGEKDPSGAS